MITANKIIRFFYCAGRSVRGIARCYYDQMIISRRTCLSHLLALAALPVFSACSREEQLRVACHVWPGYEFMFLARDEGWFSAGQIALLDSTNATESIRLLQAGDVHAAALTLDEVLLARSQGIPLTVVLVFDVSAGADKVIARPPLSQPGELKGRRIGVETTAVGSLLLIKLLAAAGLSPQDVEVVEIRGSHVEMWKSGLVDAIVTYDPTASQLIAQGNVSIFDSRQMPEMIFDVLAVRADVLSSHKDSIRTLISAHFRGLTALRKNPADTAYRLARYLGLPGHQVMGAYRGLKMPDEQANRIFLQGQRSPLLKAARALSELMLAAGTLKQADSLADLISVDFLPI